MTPDELALARARGLALLGRLLVHGIGDEDVETLAAIPGLGDASSPTSSPDDIAAAYVTAFDLGVPPYASAFLERSGHVGGAVTRGAQDDMRKSRLRPWTDEVAADHLGVLLGHLATLVGRREYAEAERFARRWLLSWLPACVVALDGVGAPFWGDVARLALALVADMAPQEQPVTASRRLPVVTGQRPGRSMLDDPACDLRAIAAHLASPARCGAFVTDADLVALGRPLHLPRGFGHRRARIETLLRAAAQYGVVPQLCAQARALFADKRNKMEALDMRAFISPWVDKLRATETMLHTMAERAAEEAAPALATAE